MGKQIVVSCDGCGVDVFGKNYMTFSPRKVVGGKQTKYQTIYLCPKCYRDTKLSVLLIDNFGLERSENS